MPRCFIFALISCLLTTCAFADDVVVDAANKRAEVVIEVSGGKLVVTLDPMTSLLVHCTNLYNLNRQSGALSYKLRNDERAKAAVEPAIFEAIAGKDRYFGGGSLDLYQPAMKRIIADRLYQRYPDASTLADAAPAPLNTAMATTWERFYKNCWESEFPRLVAAFQSMNREVKWARALDRMQTYTGRQLTGTMYVVTAEGAGQSGFTAGSDITVGAPGTDSDAAFVHEGLHLLLREQWAKSPAIQKLMAGKGKGQPPYERWEARYEQAVVVALDILIRELNVKYPEDKAVAGYFRGVGLADIAPIVFPVVKSHTLNLREPFEELMLKIVTECEKKSAPRPE